MEMGDLRAFAALDRDKAEKMPEALNDGMAVDPLYGSSMEDLQKMGLTREQARAMINWFYDFYTGAKNPGLMIRTLEAADADDGPKRTAIDAFRGIVGGRKRPDEFHDTIPAGPRRSSNEDAFDRFVYEHRNDPEFEGKCAAFVNGKCQKRGTSEDDLTGEVHEKFGDVSMMAGPVTTEPDAVEMRPPELT